MSAAKRAPQRGGIGGAPRAWRLSLALVFASVALSACAGATGAGEARGGGGNPDVISEDEVRARTESDTYALIQSLRPTWLRPRMGGTFTSAGPLLPEVFMDGRWYGAITSLRGIPSTSVETLEFISATDATTLYGTGYMAGVIHVHTRSSGVGR